MHNRWIRCNIFAGKGSPANHRILLICVGCYRTCCPLCNRLESKHLLCSSHPPLLCHPLILLQLTQRNEGTETESRNKAALFGGVWGTGGCRGGSVACYKGNNLPVFFVSFIPTWTTVGGCLQLTDTTDMAMERRVKSCQGFSWMAVSQQFLIKRLYLCPTPQLPVRENTSGKRINTFIPPLAWAHPLPIILLRHICHLNRTSGYLFTFIDW